MWLFWFHKLITVSQAAHIRDNCTTRERGRRETTKVAYNIFVLYISIQCKLIRLLILSLGISFVLFVCNIRQEQRRHQMKTPSHL